MAATGIKLNEHLSVDSPPTALPLQWQPTGLMKQVSLKDRCKFLRFQQQTSTSAQTALPHQEA